MTEDTEITAERIAHRLIEAEAGVTDPDFPGACALGIAVGAEIDRLDRRVDAVLRMRVEDAEPGSEAPTGESMPGPEWTSAEDVAAGLMIDTVGRRAMVSPAALRRALRQAVAHGRAESRLSWAHRENLRTARSAWLAGEVVEGRALSLACSAIGKLLEIEDAVGRGEGEA